MPEHAVHLPPGFRPRRGLNWAFIGLLYTSFYMCHGKCDPLHPWNRGRDGYWRCENGYFLGALLDKGWGGYFYFMAPFGVAGGMLMLSILGRVTLAKPSSSSRARGAISGP